MFDPCSGLAVTAGHVWQARSEGMGSRVFSQNQTSTDFISVKCTVLIGDPHGCTSESSREHMVTMALDESQKSGGV